MANLLKWGKDRAKQAQGVYHQLNPLDNGRTYDTNQRGVAPGTVNPNAPSDNSPGFQLTNNSLTRSASRIVDQVNQADQGRTWKQRAPVGENRGAFQQLMGGGVVGAFTQPVVKFANTGNLAAHQAVEGGKMIAADLTGNAEAGLNASNAADENYQRFAAPDSGLFGQGTFFKSPEEAARGDFKTVATRVGGGTLETAATVVPFARGASVAARGLPALKAIPALAAEGAAYNTAFGAGGQLVDNGQLDGRELLKDAAVGAVLGPAGYGAGRVVSRAVAGAPKLTPFAASQNHPAVQELNSGLDRLNQQRGQMLAGGMSESHPALKANAAAYKSIIGERNNVLKSINQGGYVRVPGGKDESAFRGNDPRSDRVGADGSIAGKAEFGTAPFVSFADNKPLADHFGTQTSEYGLKGKKVLDLESSTDKNALAIVGNNIDLSAEQAAALKKAGYDGISFNTLEPGQKGQEIRVFGDKVDGQPSVRPQADKQKALETAHNTGDTATEKRIASELNDKGLSGEMMSPAEKATLRQRLGIKPLGEEGFARVPGKAPKEKSVPSKPLLKDSLADSSKPTPPQAKPQETRQVLSKKPGTPDQLDVTPKPPHSLNVDKFNVSKKAKKSLVEAQAGLSAEIEKVRGKALTNDEVTAHADATREVLKNPKTRAATKTYLAGLKNLRGDNAALIVKRSRGKMTPAEAGRLNEGLLKQYAAAADAGRTLQSFRDTADPNERTVLDMMLKKIGERGENLKEAAAAAKKLGPNPTPKEQAAFYRTFVKATKEDWLDKYRYTNMLSSPLTHIVNTTSNMEGVLGVAPVQKLYEGAVDATKHVLTGGKSKRTRYASEAGSYYKGVAKSFPEAISNMKQVMTGERITGNPDMDSLRNIPLATSGPKAVADHVLSFVPKLLEAGDQFATTLAKGGEEAALLKRSAKGVKVDTSPAAMLKLTDDKARYRVFRQEMNKEGQGHLLDAVDIPAKLIMSMRSSENPYVRNVAKFTIPFVATPTNLFKQGIEYSPLGIGTLHGNADKTAQVAKALMGTTTVAAAAGALAAGGDITFGEPSNSKQRDAFRAEGKQPYSFKLPGSNTWVDYSKFHPAISMNLAIVGAVKEAQDKGSISDSTAERILNTGGGIVNYFTDQSYMKNVGDFVNILQGKDNTNASSIASSQATNTANQLAPFKSLTSWIGRQIDPTQRKIDSKASAWEQTYQGIVKDIPGLNKNNPTRNDPWSGEPLKNQHPEINAFLPNKVATDKNFGNTNGLNLDQREQIRDLPADQREVFRRNVVEQKFAAKQDTAEKTAIKDGREVPFKSTIKPGSTAGGNSDIKQLSSGKFYTQVNGEYKTYDTKAKAQQAVDINKFKKGKDDTKVIGDTVYIKDDSAQGYTSKKKVQYDYDNIDSKESLNMDRAKDADDVTSWLTSAQKKYDALEAVKKSYNPKTEQSKIDDATNKQEDLQRQADKYQSYGGFTKPKTTGNSARKGFQAPKGGGVDLIGDVASLNKLVTSGKVSAPRMRKKF